MVKKKKIKIVIIKSFKILYSFKFIFCLILFSNLLFAQNNLSVLVKDSKTNSPLIGANVYFNSLNTGGATNEKGLAEIKNIPDGKFTLTFSYIGYEAQKLELQFPSKNPKQIITVLLKPEEIKSKQVIVTSTRTNGVVEDSPVKVEVLGQEEVNEEVAIRPGNVSKLLGETSGVIVQQTSSVAGNVSFRLEGLPGKYTQLLKDGLPLLNRLSSGLTLLQIPPLDLQQIEVVKGSSSIFHGDGAIGGFVNIVTKKPSAKPEFDLVLNQTHKKGTDLSAFYSRKYKKFGITLLASQSFQQPVDVDGDGFTDIPGYSQSTINPKFFYDFDNTTSLVFGINAFSGDRTGGDIYAIDKGTNLIHNYYERNKSQRLGTELVFGKKLANGSRIDFKNNYYYYKRKVEVHDRDNDVSLFAGRQIYSFNEFSYSQKLGVHYLVSGINFITDNFKQTDGSNYKFYDYSHSTYGVFFQDDWSVTDSLILQPGIRVDYQNPYGAIVLPHLSVLYKLTNNFHTRLTYGSGYKNPSYFDLPIVPHLYYHLIEFDKTVTRQTANSFNVDFGYKYFWGDFVLKINQAFFYTKVKNTLIAYHIPNNVPPLRYFGNGTLTTKGFDTNLYLALDELELFADYTFNEVQKDEITDKFTLPLTPKNKLNMTLTYEEEGKWRTGLEAFYTGKQYLSNGNYSRSYWLLGAMFKKMFNDFSVVLNVENLLDERQSKYEKIVEGQNRSPNFKSLYMPIDGIVVNVAVRIKIR